MSEERCFQLLCLVSWCRRVSRPVSRPPERFHEQDLQSPCLMESHLHGSSLAAGEGSIFEEPVVSKNALETVLKSSRISAVDAKVRRPKMVLCSSNKIRSSLNSPASTKVFSCEKTLSYCGDRGNKRYSSSWHLCSYSDPTTSCSGCLRTTQ